MAQNPVAWLARRCTSLNENPGGCPFLWSALVISPQWLAHLEPLILSQPIGHDKVPMFFWGPHNGPGVAGKIGKLLQYATINFFLKWPWSWWVPGSRSVKDLHQNTWKHGSRYPKESSSKQNINSAKKRYHFLRWISFSYWQGPFNGCHIPGFTKFEEWIR